MSIAIEQQRGDRQRYLRRGVGIAVVNLDGQIWTHKDASSRAETGRQAGLPSIIFESKKVDETHEDNLRGGLAELINKSSVPYVARRLFTTDGLQSSPPLTYNGGENIIQYQLVVLIYNGPKGVLFQAHDTEEIEPIGWMSTEIFLAQPVRPLARAAVTFMHNDGTIRRKLDEFQSGLGQPVIDPAFSIEAFYTARERKTDFVEPIVVYTG